MAKRIRVTKPEADGGSLAAVASAAPARAGDGDAAKSTARAKAKAAPTPAEGGKHVMLPAFLSKTFEIFSMPEFSNICGWNASGDTIIVSQLEAFVAMVLPRFFKHRNFPSFVRQLNLYGFHKTVLDSKRLEFQHPYFKRDRPDLLHHIKRKVSSGSHHQQQLVNTSLQNSRLDAHREISDTLLREMKELRQKSDAMEKRLRELEIDNAIVRSDNVKLWKHLETAKDKQLVMQEKMKKIMWILFQIYRGKQQNLPKLSSNDSTANGTVFSEDYVNSSMLGPKEFRDVLRFLAMDEPPMLPGSSSTDVASTTQGSRKRKFVEVPADSSDTLGSETQSSYKLDAEPSSVVEVPSPMHDTTTNQFAMTLPNSNPQLPPSAHSTSDNQNNVLSLFSPISMPLPVASSSNSNSNSNSSATPSTADASNALGAYLTNGTDASEQILNSIGLDSVSAAMDGHLATSAAPATTTTTSVAPVTPTVPAASLPASSAAQSASATSIPSVSTTSAASSAPDVVAPPNHLGFMEDELPLLSDSEHYSFNEGEQEQVMKKLEDFETSLLDEYDVNCLDTLLQQLKNSAGEKPTGVTVTDPEEIVVGPNDATQHHP